MDKEKRKAQSEADKAWHKENFNKNLHGSKGVEGLTGFRGSIFYLAGVPRGRARFLVEFRNKEH